MSAIGDRGNDDPTYHYIAKDDIADKCRVQEEKHHPPKEVGILDRIVDGVKDVADSFTEKKSFVVEDSLNKPAPGQADFITTGLCIFHFL